MSIPGPEVLTRSSHPVMGMAIPYVVRRVLPNGLTLLVQEDHAHPLVAFQAVVRTGSATEGSFAGTGISHVVEHMLFKGTPRRPVGAVEQEAQSYGGTSQGFTTYDTTSYQLIVNKESWSQGADLLVDALFNPNMDPEEFAKEREVVLRELKLRRDDPEHVVWDLLFENAYRVHPYRMPIIGYESLVRSLTHDDLVSYHRSRYRTNNMVIAVVGDVETQAVLKRMEELTEGFTPGSIPPQALPEEPFPLVSREITQEADLNLGMIAMGFPSVPLNHPDLYALDLLSWVLGGSRGSRLEHALKEEGIVHSVECANYTPRERGLFVVTMRSDADKISQAVQGALQEIARAREGPFESTEVEVAKRALLRDYVASRQTVGGQASDLAGYEVLAGEPTFAARYIEQVNQVTPEDLKRVAASYLKSEQVTTVKLFPRGSAPSPKEIAPSSELKSTAQKVVLGNGLRVLLQPDHRLPLVDFQVSMLGGVRYEAQDTQGISALTARMLLRGSRHKSAQEIIQQVKEMGGELGQSSGRNSLGLTLEVVSSQAPRAAQLLGELILEPTFPLKELEKERRLLLAQLKAKEEDPFGWGMRRLAVALFTVHPYRWDPSGEPKAIARLKSEDLSRFYSRLQDPKGMVFSVVGDFEPQELIKLLEESFGKLAPQESKPLSVPQEPPLLNLKEHREVTPRQEGLLMIGFPGIKITDPKGPVLDLIETILSGGAGRLFTEVRERRGLAYAVGAFGLYGVDPGAFVLYAVSDPAQLKTVRQALLEEVRRLGASPLPQEEMTRAQQGLLGNRRIARQTFGALAAQMATDELFGLGFDYSQKYDSKVQAATRQEVQALAKALLDPQRCVVVVGFPEGTDLSARTAPVEPKASALSH